MTTPEDIEHLYHELGLEYYNSCLDVECNYLSCRHGRLPSGHYIKPRSDYEVYYSGFECITPAGKIVCPGVFIESMGKTRELINLVKFMEIFN
jgi:hypothetical protein